MATHQEELAMVSMDPGEVAAVEYANIHYGAEAKLEATKLVVALELDDGTTGTVIDSFANRIDKLDFVEKRTAIEHFRNLYLLLGQTSIGDRLELIAVPSSSTETSEEPKTNDFNQESENGEVFGPIEIDTSPLLKSKLRQNLLVKFFGEENRSVIEELTVNKAVKLASALGNLYLELKVARATAEGKAIRVQQFKEYIGGTSFEELAGQHEGQTKSGIGQGFNTMSGSVTKRVEPETLQLILDSVQH